MKTSVTVRLDGEQAKQLTDACKETNRTISDIVRTALEDFFCFLNDKMNHKV